MGTAIPKVTAIDYLPLVVGNEWVYENSFYNDGQLSLKNEETLKVVHKDTSQLQETSAYTLSSNLASTHRGATTDLFVNGKLNKVRGRIIFNGNFKFHFPHSGDSIRIPLRNLVLMDQNKDDGEAMFAVRDTLTETLNLSETELPVRIITTLKTYEIGAHNTFSNGNTEFTNVVQSQLVFGMEIGYKYENGTFETLLSEEEVLKTTNYFAKEIGLILSQSEVKLNFENLSSLGIPEIPFIHQTSSQVLKEFSLKNTFITSNN